MMEAEAITRALSGRWTGRSGIACCPAHEDRSPSLSIAQGHTGQLLLTCHAGCAFEEILDALKAQGMVRGRNRFRENNLALLEKRKMEERLYEQRRAYIARKVWQDTLPVYGTLAETYLRSRGITCALPTSLSYLRDCWHPSAKRLPALIGSLRGCDAFAVHRTYLRIGGDYKTRLSPGKAMLGATKGGAVPLSEMSDRLVVTEGIETGLSLLSGLIDGPITVWAALSATGMKSLRLPDRPGDLVIAPDGDDIGRASAEVLAQRAYGLGWRVSLMAAPEGCDWNDVLTGKVKPK